MTRQSKTFQFEQVPLRWAKLPPETYNPLRIPVYVGLKNFNHPLGLDSDPLEEESNLDRRIDLFRSQSETVKQDPPSVESLSRP